MELPRIDYSMVHQYVVEIGSLWDYNRSLDNASNTRALKVIGFKKYGNRVQVVFEQKMPFGSYGISYFDGYTFKPHKKN